MTGQHVPAITADWEKMMQTGHNAFVNTAPYNPNIGTHLISVRVRQAKGTSVCFMLYGRCRSRCPTDRARASLV